MEETREKLQQLRIRSQRNGSPSDGSSGGDEEEDAAQARSCLGGAPLLRDLRL